MVTTSVNQVSPAQPVAAGSVYDLAVQRVVEATKARGVYP